MALRIRKSGRIVCAKYHKERQGDVYVNDALHYRLAVDLKVIRPVNRKGTVWKFWQSRTWK
jgi:hypothetical protein